MSQPRLTIAIPTVDRPKTLKRAIDSCLAQSIPVRVLVCDQGTSGETAEVVKEIADDLVEWHPTFATTLWENWRWGAYQAFKGDSEFFSWLQDDDVIRPNYAKRIIDSFDRFPDAVCWQARNMLAVDERLGYWTGGNGPWVPMNFQEGTPDEWEGQILVPTSYFTSWSLSPAVAFQCGPEFERALDLMPLGFDLFQERAILAATCFDGRFIADPTIAGMWIQHEANESNRLHHDQPRQTGILVDWLDSLMDKTEGWQEMLGHWCRLMHPASITEWSMQIGVTQEEGHPGKYTEAIKDIMLRSLEKRVTVSPIHNMTSLMSHHGTDKFSVHRYDEEYDRHFAPLRNKPVKLLEIGVGGYDSPNCGGESLRVWRDYFAKGQINGLDIVDKGGLDLGDRIIVWQGSQADPAYLSDLSAAAGPFDIIIDDGSHQQSDIMASFRTLFPRLASGGIYVIEDLATAYDPAYGGNNAPFDIGFGRETTAIKILTRSIDSMHRESPVEPWSLVKSVHVSKELAFIYKA